MATTMSIDPEVAKKEFNEYLDLVASVQKAEIHAAKLDNPGKDGRSGEFENVTVTTRMRYNDGTTTLVHTSEDFDRYVALFIQKNAKEVAERALLEAAIMLSNEKKEAEDAMLAAGLTPGVVSVPGTPVVNNPSFTYVGHQNKPFSFQITTDPVPAGESLYFIAFPLPAGLFIDNATGLITGTPAVIGTTTVNVKVKNTATNLYTLATFTITIGQPLAPTITSPMTASATVGTPFTYQITGTQLTGATYAVATLPAWLTLTGDTMSGTPAAADVGTFNLAITITTAGGTATDTLVLTVA